MGWLNNILKPPNDLVDKPAVMKITPNEAGLSAQDTMVAVLIVLLLCLAGVKAFMGDDPNSFCRESAVTFPDVRVRFQVTEQGCTYFHPAWGTAEEITNPVY